MIYALAATRKHRHRAERCTSEHKHTQCKKGNQDHLEARKDVAAAASEEEEDEGGVGGGVVVW